MQDQVVVPDLEATNDNEQPNKPFYYSADDTNEGYKNVHNASLYIDRKTKPTLSQLVDTCQRERISQYVTFEQGMWVEYRSNDMQWKVGVVNRVIKQPPKDWDFDVRKEDPPDEVLEISYNVGVEGVVSPDNIRAPTKGLEALFGMRPFLWQQFVLLQIEKRLRYDEYHEYDFEQLDKLKFATKRWEAFLNASQNRDFKELHDSQPPITRQLLRSYLLTPFDLMDFIVERERDWDFDDEDISVYTYFGVLGSGGITILLTWVIQIITPLFLVYNNILETDLDASTRFFVDPDDDNVNNFIPSNGGIFPDTNFTTFCNGQNDFEGKVIISLVLLIYFASVVPDSVVSFYRTSGGEKSTSSKINSLRNIIWEQNDDTVWQEIGFKTDRLMNTGYLAVLYTVMIFIMLNTPLVLDLILNALAIEFIHRIDERLADADWWDDSNRWIKAGTIELVIQGVLRLRWIESPNTLCKNYNIDKHAYAEALGGMKSLRDRRQASKDEKNNLYMTKREIEFEKVARDAYREREFFVVEEYRKKLVPFSIIDYITIALGIKRKGIFFRYIDYRVWSRWEKILFLPKLPDEAKLNEKMDHFAEVKLGKDDYTEFMIHVRRVLSFLELATTVADSARHWILLQNSHKDNAGTWRMVSLSLLATISFFGIYLHISCSILLLDCIASRNIEGNFADDSSHFEPLSGN